MAGAPPPPPPLPPNVAYAPPAGAPPPPGYAPGPVFFGGPRPMPGTTVPDQVAKIRDGAMWFLIYLALSFLAAIGSAAIDGYVTVGGIGAVGGGRAGAAIAAGSAAGAAVLGLVAFVAFIVLIVSWVKWRGGVKELPSAAAFESPTYQQAAVGALKDYGRTVWTFIIILLSTIVFVIAVVAVALSSLFSACGGMGTNVSKCITASTGGVANAVIETTIVYALFVVLLEFLMYYFASRSLVGALHPLATPELQEQLSRGRMIMLIGAGLAPLGVVNPALTLAGVSVAGIAFLGLLTPLLLLLGMYYIHGAYGSWLSSHPPGQYPPGVPGWPTQTVMPAPPPAVPYGAPPR